MGTLDVQTDELTWRDLDERFPELDRRELHDGALVGPVDVVDRATSTSGSTSRTCCCPRGARDTPPPAARLALPVELLLR